MFKGRLKKVLPLLRNFGPIFLRMFCFVIASEIWQSKQSFEAIHILWSEEFGVIKAMGISNSRIFIILKHKGTISSPAWYIGCHFKMIKCFNQKLFYIKSIVYQSK